MRSRQVREDLRGEHVPQRGQGPVNYHCPFPDTLAYEGFALIEGDLEAVLFRACRVSKWGLSAFYRVLTRVVFISLYWVCC